MVFLFGITASTFAWFKINSNASVSGFEFTVQGGEGYQISIDNENYSNSLSNEQMLQAILMGYDSGYHVINKNLYYGTTFDNNGNVISLGSLINTDRLKELVSEIQLLPVTPHKTSTGAFSFRNYSGNTISASYGQYVEFSIYFRGLGKEEDNQTYNLYVLGENFSDELTGEAAPRTSIKSKVVNHIPLKAKMTAIDNSTLSTNPLDFKDRTTKAYNKDETIDVYTSNAIRFSIGNENDDDYKTDSSYEIKNLIYEVSDDSYYDLGSYATDYDMYILNSHYEVTSDVNSSNYASYFTYDKENKQYIQATSYDIETTYYKERTSSDEGYKTYSSLEHNLYDCNSNAQYTYYNNLRSYAKQTPMEYSSLQSFNVINHLITNAENKDENSEYYQKRQYFTTIKSGDKPHKLTFRFWLEGWDADCFEGISSSIRVNLSIGSDRVI